MGIICKDIGDKINLRVRSDERTLAIWNIDKNGMAYKIFEDKLSVMVNIGEI